MANSLRRSTYNNAFNSGSHGSIPACPFVAPLFFLACHRLFAQWSSHCKKSKLAFQILFLFCTSLAIHGQQDGIPPFAAADYHDVDTVNLMSLIPVLNVHAVSKPGLIPFAYTLTASQSCHITGQTQSTIVSCNTGDRFSGFTTALLGASLMYTNVTQVQCNGQWINSYSGYELITSDGLDAHPIDPNVHLAGTCSPTFNQMTIDGSGYNIQANSSGTVTVTSSAGHISNSGSSNEVDPFGNSLAKVYNQDSTVSYIDSMGITILTEYSSIPDNNAANRYVQWPDTTGATQQITFVTGPPLTFSLHNTCAAHSQTGTMYPINKIQYPDGTYIGITMETGYAGVGTTTGRIASFTTRNGGTVSYTYPDPCSGLPNGPSAYSLTRTTQEGTTTYSVQTANGLTTTTVIDPAGNKKIYYFSTPGTLTEVDAYQNTGTIANPVYAPLTTDVICYNKNQSNCKTAWPINDPITQRDWYHTIVGMGTSSRVSTTYDGYGNVTAVTKFDFGASNYTLQTTTQYGSWNGSACVSIGNGINNKPCNVLSSDGTHTISNELYTYDAHGELLTHAVWNGSNWLSNSTPDTYNTNGTVATSYDLSNQPTTYSYSPASYVDCTGCTNYPFPTSISKGGLTTSSTWNGIGGVKMSETDANDKTTTYTYGACATGTADPFWRVMSISDPVGSTTCNTYATGSSPDSQNTSFSFNSGKSVKNTTRTEDGYGRLINVQKQQGPSSTSYDTVSTVYGWSGGYRTVAKSLPCSQPLGQSCSTTHTDTYDINGRLAQATTANNETLTHTYSVNDDLVVLTPAPAGENAKSTQTEYDGLGRKKSVCQILVSGGGSCGQATAASGYVTTYAYGTFSGGTTTTVTRGAQSRTVKYDALGRVTSETHPETGTVTNTYDSVNSGSCNVTSPGDLVLKTDNAGNGTCYQYDGLHRVISVSQSNRASLNDAATPRRYFVYDAATVNGATMTNTKGRLAEAYTVGDVVYNPDFANGSNWGLPTGWSISNGQEYAVGATDVASSNIDGGGSPWKPIQPGQSVNLSGWIYRIGGTGVMDWGGAFVDVNHNLTGWFSCGAATGGSTGTGSWTYVTSSSVAPANTAYYELYTELHGCNDTDQTQTSGYFSDLWASVAGQKTTDEGFSYDADGRLTDVYEATPHSGGYYHTTAAYWPTGTLQSLGGLPGYPTMSYGLDGEGRLSSAMGGSTKVVCDSTCSASSTTYDAASNPLVINIAGNGTNGSGDHDAYTYDSLERMKSYTYTVGATPVSMTGTLTWNANGTLRQLAITDGFNTGGTQTCNYGTSSTMGYDDLGRLLNVNCNTWQQTFSYDEYDNITKTGSISWACATCYDANTNHYNNNISSLIKYDTNGNLLNDIFNQYSWDAYGHPVTIMPPTGTGSCGMSGVTCVTYDASGRAVEKSVGGTFTQILYSPIGKTGTMTGQTTNSAYFPLPGGGTYYVGGSTGGNNYYWHKDWLGTARLATTLSNRSLYYDRAFAPYGEMYDNFGNTTALDFTGDTQDIVTGTYDTPERELNPSQGRWLSPDPARGGWNLYSYSTNPNTATDPTGLIAGGYWGGFNQCGGMGCYGLLGGYVDDFSGSTLSRLAEQSVQQAGIDAGVDSLPIVSSTWLATFVNMAQAVSQEPDPKEDERYDDPAEAWGAPLVRLLPGQTLEDEFPPPYRWNLLNPGPLNEKVAASFAGGQYNEGVVGGQGLSFDALTRAWGGTSLLEGYQGTFYSPLPQAGGLQSQIELNLRPEWGNTAENVTCVYLAPGTVYYYGPMAAQTGFSMGSNGPGVTSGMGGPQSLGISGNIQLFVPRYP